MHSRRYNPDVQDPGFELLDHGVQFECAVSGRNQVR